jgi:hypothetical protein
MKVKKFPKILKQILTTTEEDEKIPKSEKLDSYIKTLKEYMKHVYPLTLYIISKKIANTLKYKWVSLLKKIFRGFIFISFFYMTYQLYLIPKNESVKEAKVRIIERKVYKEHPFIPQGNLNFMKALSLLESNDNYRARRSNSQYWGAYQFGKKARIHVGVGEISVEKFLSDPYIQDWTMNEYMKINYRLLKKCIKEYNIPKKGGVRIGYNLVTVSGLIAAAHLVGHKPVKYFIKTNGKDLWKNGRNLSRDGNNVHLTHYLQLNNYELEFNLEKQ